MLQQAHSELDRLKARLSRSSQEIVGIKIFVDFSSVPGHNVRLPVISI